MIRMTYTVAGVSREYQFEDDRLDELLRRADEQFLPALSAADERRFRAILKDDQKRRAGNVRKNVKG